MQAAAQSIRSWDAVRALHVYQQSGTADFVKIHEQHAAVSQTHRAEGANDRGLMGGLDGG